MPPGIFNLENATVNTPSASGYNCSVNTGPTSPTLDLDHPRTPERHVKSQGA